MTRTRENDAQGELAAGQQENIVVVGLGGNLGEVRQTFREALAELSLHCALGRVSSLYASAPVGPEQPDFLNAAVLVDWPEPLSELLQLTQRLELRAGRERRERWGPRTLDLDLLWAGDRVERSSSLIVPHPCLRERRFALEPLIELVPHARHPEWETNLSETLATLENQRVHRVADVPW